MVKCHPIFYWWKFAVFLVTPLALLPVVAHYDFDLKVSCGYMMVVMAVYWITEAVPMAVTALLPVVMAPLFGIMKSREICPNYFKDTNFLFIGGLMMAVTIEHWELHRRIALGILSLVGTKPRSLMMGFMLPTWFLSMWISNTATTAMMIPIVQAVIEQIRLCKLAELKKPESDGIDMVDLSKSAESSQTGSTVAIVKTDDIKIQTNNTDMEITSPTSPSYDTVGVVNGVTPVLDQLEGETIEEPKEVTEYIGKIGKLMSLCIAYAANAGGIATLKGTPPNLVLTGQLDVLFKGKETGVTFASWMGFALPISIITLLFCWIWLQICFLGLRGTFGGCFKCGESVEEKTLHDFIKDQYKKLGRMSCGEIMSLLMFILLALLWILRSPAPGSVFKGWGDYFKAGYASDATCAIFVSILLFAIPSELPSCSGSGRRPRPLMTWEVLTHRLPWNIVLLLGGGFAMADASQKSGLSEWIGKELTVLEFLPNPVIAIIVSAIIAALTEVTSNTATATLMLPILANLAVQLKTNPLYFMLPATVSASFAFMLPVATPPNAIVFSSGYLKIWEMFVVGFVMNVVCIGTVGLAVIGWGSRMYGLDTYPDWARALEAATTTTISQLNITNITDITSNTGITSSPLNVTAFANITTT
ncbi:Na(+)/citrate cotransporter-like [Tubulanus polymorphus]|uniref:Na(+)/citrate cotransporter-like n=1 Tax=Tubulanus polymorphus TaxID=672921 RepID=UPI003DA5D033